MVRATLPCVFSLPNPSFSFGIVQVGEVAPAFDGAIPSASASSAPSSAPSAPSSADSPGGGNGGGADEDTPEGRDAMECRRLLMLIPHLRLQPPVPSFPTYQIEDLDGRPLSHTDKGLFTAALLMDETPKIVINLSWLNTKLRALRE